MRKRSAALLYVGGAGILKAEAAVRTTANDVRVVTVTPTPTGAPTPTVTPEPVRVVPAPLETPVAPPVVVYFNGCTEARAAGVTPWTRAILDTDRDSIAMGTASPASSANAFSESRR